MQKECPGVTELCCTPISNYDDYCQDCQAEKDSQEARNQSPLFPTTDEPKGEVVGFFDKKTQN